MPSRKFFGRCSVAMVMTTLLAVGIAVGGPMLIDWAINSGIAESISYDNEDTDAYKAWITNEDGKGVPWYKLMYFYNLTNADAWLRGEEKPHVEEIGPFHYDEYRVHFNVSITGKEDSRINYQSYIYYVYNEEKSCDGCAEDIALTTVNPAYLGVGGSVSEQLAPLGIGGTGWTQLGINMLGASLNESLVRTLTPAQIAFGFDDPMLAFVSGLLNSTGQEAPPPTFQGVQPNMTSKDDAFPYSAQATGSPKIEDVFEYEIFRAAAKQTYWNSSEANALKGTDGSQFHPQVKKSQNVTVFVDDVFRSISFYYKEETEHKDIHMYRFIIQTEQFKNASQVPDHAAYYMFGPHGVINLTTASQFAPVIASNPHFLDADPFYLEQVSGVSPPSFEKHGTYLDIEPLSGTTMKARKRLQVNVHVKPRLLTYQDLIEAFVPVMWVEEGAEVTDKLAAKFRSKVYLALTLKQIFLWGGAVIAGVLAVFTVWSILIWRRKKRADEEPFSAVPSRSQRLINPTINEAS